MSTADGLFHPPLIPSESDPSDVVDLAVIGAGPVGLFAAFYAGMRKLSVKVIDAHHEVGGQLSVFYPAEVIYDVAGYPGVSARELVRQLDRQAQFALPTFCLGEQVVALRSVGLGQNQADRWQIKTDRATHYARTVVLAVGAGQVTPKRSGITSVKAFEGNSVFYCPTLFKRSHHRRVLVVGRSEHALSAALDLASAGRQVTLAHPRPDLHIPDSLLAQLRQTSVTLRLGYDLADVRGVDSLSSALLAESRRQTYLEVPTDAVLIMNGYDTSLRPIEGWGLTLSANGIAVNGSMSTNLDGVFAAGDIAVYPGKVKLIAVGFGEAAVAVNHACQFVRPTEKLFPGYSTSVGPRRLPGLMSASEGRD